MAIAKYVLYAFVPLILVNIKLFDHIFIIIVIIITPETIDKVLFDSLTEPHPILYLMPFNCMIESDGIPVSSARCSTSST